MKLDIIFKFTLNSRFPVEIKAPNRSGRIEADQQMGDSLILHENIIPPDMFRLYDTAPIDRWNNQILALLVHTLSQNYSKPLNQNVRE